MFLGRAWPLDPTRARAKMTIGDLLPSRGPRTTTNIASWPLI